MVQKSKWDGFDLVLPLWNTFYGLDWTESTINRR